MKKIYSLIFILLIILTGCSQSKEIKETTLSKDEIEKQNIVFDKNGNSGIYVIQEIDDVIPETLIPIDIEETEKKEEILETLQETTATIETEESVSEDIEITSDGTYTVNADVNVRDMPNSDTSNVLGVLLYGENISILGEENGWIKIEYNNTSGYIYQDFVQKN